MLADTPELALRLLLSSLSLGSGQLQYLFVPAQDDVVARIMDKLDAASLSSIEWVCKRFRSLGAHAGPHCSLSYDAATVGSADTCVRLQ